MQAVPFKRHAILWKAELRNAALYTLQSTGGAFASPLMLGGLVPAIIVRLGGSDLLIGLVSTLANAVGVPSLLLAAYVGVRTRRKGVASLVWNLVNWWVYLPALLVLLLSGRSPSLTAFVAAIMAAVVMAALSGSVASVIQVDLLSRIITPERRGRVTGIAGAMSGASGLAGGVLLSLLLARLAFPKGYGIASVVGLIIGSLPLIMFLAYRELPGLKTSAGARLPGLLHSLQVIRGDRRFLRVLAAAMLKYVFNAATIFVVPVALRRHGLPDTFVGHFAILTSIVTIGVGPLGGWSADRWGISRTAFIGGIVAAIGISLYPHAVSYAFVLASSAVIVAGSTLIGTMFFLAPMHLSPPEHRSAYIAMRYLAESVAGVLCTPLVGYAIMVWNPAYVFYVAAAAAVASGSLLVRATGWYCRPQEKQGTPRESPVGT